MPRTASLALVCAALATLSSLCPAQEPDRAAAAGELQLLASVVVANRSIDGHRPVELSALAFDRDQRELYAASDRGVLFRLALQWQAGRLLGATAAAAWPLRHPVDGSALDVEALAWRPAWSEGDAELLVAPEFGATAFRLDIATRSIATLAWPRGAAPAAERSTSSRHGVEALDWHPVHGSIVVMQRPASDVSQLQSRPTVYTLLNTHGIKDPQELRQQRAGLIWLQAVTQLTISSTAIRAQLAQGASIRYLVPDKVITLIQQQGIY